MASTGPSAEELKVQLVSEEKYMEDRIAHVERNFASLASDLAGITRKMARLRDKGDLVVKTLRDFSTTESGGTRKSLEGMSECLTALENFQQLGIDRMEAKVVKPLLEYDNTCRKAREEIRGSHGVWEKEVTKQRNLDRARVRDPTNRKRISQLETDTQKMKIERLRVTKMLEEYMEAFERRRTQDLKSILTEYIHSEMAFHAKALELYTLAFQHVQTISEEESVELFHRGLHPRKTLTHGSHTDREYARSSRGPSPTTVAGGSATNLHPM